MVPKEGGEPNKPTDPFHILLGKALIDVEYREKLLDPNTRVDALKDVGIAHPTEVQLQALQNAITALTTLSGSFGEGVGAA
jgi:hypothetical protein